MLFISKERRGQTRGEKGSISGEEFGKCQQASLGISIGCACGDVFSVPRRGCKLCSKPSRLPRREAGRGLSELQGPLAPGGEAGHSRQGLRKASLRPWPILPAT